MDLRDGDLQHRVEADRREVNPPIEVETATWSKAGQLAVNGGSELLIFVPRAGHSHDLSARSCLGLKFGRPPTTSQSTQSAARFATVTSVDLRSEDLKIH